MNVLLVKIWRLLRGTPQWYILWFAHPKFIIGVSGVVLNDQQQILLLRHRFWRPGSWGLPSGYANRNEKLEDTLRREVREETGYEVAISRYLRMVSGFFPLPDGGSPGQSFYHFQYGINFRKWNGKSYSAKDPIRSISTRNLGNIMEVATDRFAHEFVSSIADQIGYTAPSNPTENWIYRDCTGLLTPADMLHLREIEQGRGSIDATPAFQTYLKIFCSMGPTALLIS